MGAQHDTNNNGITYLYSSDAAFIRCVSRASYRHDFDGCKKANSFNPDGSDVSNFSNRLCRAHANCYEGFPIFGGLLLLAIASDTMAITNGLAYILIGARLGQSFIHLASTSVVAVFVRFGFS